MDTASSLDDQTKYHTLLDSIDEGFHRSELLYDSQGQPVDWRFLEVNPIFEQQTGLQDVVGKLGSQIAPDTESYWLLAYDKVLKTGESIRFENFNQATERWYSAFAFRMGGASSRQFAVLFSDITESKRIEEALRQNQKRQTFLLRLSDALRPVSDPVHIQKTATSVARDQFQADRCYYCEIVDGKAVIRRDSAREDLPSVAGVYDLTSMPILQTVIDAGVPFIVNDVHTTDLVDEHLRQLCIQLQVISFVDVPVIKNGKPVGVLCVVQDQYRQWSDLDVTLAEEVAERTWMAVERAHAEEALRQADRRKDEFLAMLAHELRNPMSTIRSGLQFMKLTAGKDEVSNDAIAMMDRQTAHLVRMVDDLLDVSRISQGKIELRNERVDLVALVSQSAESIRALYRQENKTLTVELPSYPLLLNGDGTRLAQMINNLLTNGVRYTEENGQVWLKLTKQGTREALLEVRDDGIGISEDQIHAIFDLFVQVDNSLARAKGGLGVGLTLVKRLAEMHGGSVQAYSDGLGKGSTFKIVLPILETTDRVSDSASTENVQAHDRRVLVIDDNRDAAQLVSMLLKLKGYEVHTCFTGREGIDTAATFRPAAILMDIGMPGLDGFETCELIRAQPWGRSVTIIALTGYGQAEDRQRTKDAGFDGHLVKPVDFDELLSLLAQTAR